MSDAAPPVRDMFAEALRLHQVGRLREAEELYRRVLAAAPQHADALHLMGVIAHQVGRSDVAADYIGRAIALAPRAAHFHTNLGNALKALGRLTDAEASFREALRLQPDFADAHNNLGGVLRRLGRLHDAQACYEEALRLMPDLPEAHNNLGNIYKDQQKLDDAERSYQAALRLNPSYAEAHHNLGVLYAERRRFADAARAFGQAVALKPGSAAAHGALGYMQMELGDHTGAFMSFRTATQLEPENPQAWADWAGCLAGHEFSFGVVDDRLFGDLLCLLDRPETHVKQVMRTALAALRHHPDVAALLARSADGVEYAPAAERLSAIPLLIRAISLACVNVPEFERLFTALRTALLTSAARGEDAGAGLRFSAALALQCFINEYAFAESADEAAAVGRLQTSIASRLETGQTVPSGWIAALGCYRPLYAMPWCEKLDALTWPEPLGEVVRQQVTEPLQERALQADIARLTPVNDAVSQTVRGQYEDNPYPRWMKPVLRHRADPLREILRHEFPHAVLDGPWPAAPEILIAGCGTGRQAIDAATRYAGARVTAIDLSLASLAYALRQTRELGLTNIQYAQADILELGAWDRQFDLIECAGVLHHLREPLAGWRQLVAHLRTGGLMRIGLYSELGRRGVVRGRAMIAAQGYTTSPDDIRRCRQDILRLAGDPTAAAAEPELAALTQSDIYSLSECRDLLFHVQEHRFTIPQIADALAALDLEFLGFETRRVVQHFRKQHPDPAALTSLPLWHEFEQANPDSFIAMYQFWCRKR